MRDEQRSGLPSKSITDDNVCRAGALIQADRRIHVTDIAQELNISIGSAHITVYEQLGYRKTCTSWAPRHLTDEYKATRIPLSLQHLMRFQRESISILHRILSMDETWVHHMAPETKRATMSWKDYSSPPRKKFKTTPSAKKVIATAFWYNQVVLLIDFFTRVAPWILHVIVPRWIGCERQFAGNDWDYSWKVSCCGMTTPDRIRLQ